MAWRDYLQRASWNEVPFFTDTAASRVGRLTAEHIYPFRQRDPAWVEDLGLLPGTHQITGFLIGDDVVDQQDAMMTAVLVPGPGVLVHPMLGRLFGSIVGGAEFNYRREDGRYVEFSFGFVENRGGAPYPATAPDTQSGVAAAATNATAASNNACDASAPNGSLPQARQDAGAINTNAAEAGSGPVTPSTYARRGVASQADASAQGEQAYADARSQGLSPDQATLRAQDTRLQARNYASLSQANMLTRMQ